MKWGEVTWNTVAEAQIMKGLINRGVVQLQCGELIMKQLAILLRHECLTAISQLYRKTV